MSFNKDSGIMVVSPSMAYTSIHSCFARFPTRASFRASAPLYPFTNKLAATGHTLALKPQKSNESTPYNCSELQHPNISSSHHQPCFPNTHLHQKTLIITTKDKLRQPGTGACFGGAEERRLLATKTWYTTKHHKKEGLNKPMARIQTIL